MVRTRLAIVVIAVTLAVMISLGGGTNTPDSASQETTNYLTVTEDRVVWPYTSHLRGFHGKTLPINVVVYGEPEDIYRFLTERSRGVWNETDAETEDIHPIEGERNGTFTSWGAAEGATRYTYVTVPTGETGAWIDEDYQLHDGDYFGSRHHIRVYRSPGGERDWVVIQAHHDHWDWFRLRHTVDGVSASQAYLEREFIDWGGIPVSRRYVGNSEGTDMDGWVTVVDLSTTDRSEPASNSKVSTGQVDTSITRSGLTVATIVLGVPILRRLRNSHTRYMDQVSVRTRQVGSLFGSVIGVYLAVRFGAIAVERYVPVLDPVHIGGIFYPLLVVALPVTAYALGKRVDPQDGFVAAGGGFVLVVLLDFTFLQVTVVPIDTLVHRLSLAIAIGLIAMGSHPRLGRQAESGTEANPQLRMGVLLWLSALLLPLLRFL